MYVHSILFASYNSPCMSVDWPVGLSVGHPVGGFVKYKPRQICRNTKGRNYFISGVKAPLNLLCLRVCPSKFDKVTIYHNRAQLSYKIIQIIREDTHKNKWFFSCRTTKDVGRVNSPDH